MISARTQTGRQPLKVDLKRIDYIPFRGLLQAAGAEIKAVKAWVGCSVLTMRLWQRSKANSPVWEVLCYSCARSPVIFSVSQSQPTVNTSVSCFWLVLEVIESRSCNVTARWGKGRDLSRFRFHFDCTVDISWSANISSIRCSLNSAVSPCLSFQSAAEIRRPFKPLLQRHIKLHHVWTRQQGLLFRDRSKVTGKSWGSSQSLVLFSDVVNELWISYDP